MGKNKLAKFDDMEAFPHVFQYTFAACKETIIEEGSNESALLDLHFPLKGKWNTFFGNDNPIVVELGCGKGEYTVGLAELYPDKNFIGVDIKGARMWTGAKSSFEKGMKNVAFIRTNIEIISQFFAEGEVSEIWLTFPDPQMKKVRKRLTSTRFMQLYQQFVKTDGIIHLKTDSNFLFQYTCEMVKSNSYRVDYSTDDLYHSDFSDDKILSIRTFYEQQWLDRGLTIKYIRFHLLKKTDFIEPDVDIEYDSYRSYNRTRRTQETKKIIMDRKEIQSLVEKEIKKLNWDIQPKGLYEPIEYVLSLGGKRIRPVVALMACQLFSGDIKAAIRPALALEVFHNFTLLHDDIMDKADMRRGQPTVHVKWNDNTAILSGDGMLIKAYQLLEQCEPQHLAEILPVFSKTAIEVCDGQQYDMDFESRNNVTVEEYIEMIRLKTAVLLAGSLKIGAICGGASEVDAQRLYDFGIGIGLAFQLKDDLLDVYGDSKTFGKEIGGDICCNKKTFMLINALKKAEGEDLKSLTDWITKESFNRQEKIAAVTAIYDKLHIKELAESKMDEYYQQAINSLKSVSIDEEKKNGFYQLAEKLMYRIS